MKLRIISLVLMGALALSLFEIWRYRAANKDFKSLYEGQRAENLSNLYASWPCNEGLRALLNSRVFAEGYLKFLECQLSYSRQGSDAQFWSSDAADAPLRPSATIQFSVEKPLAQAQTAELDEIVEALKADYPESNGLWRIVYKVDQGKLRFYFFANAPITDVRFSRFE
jgi:hypothetical protein